MAEDAEQNQTQGSPRGRDSRGRPVTLGQRPSAAALDWRATREPRV